MNLDEVKKLNPAPLRRLYKPYPKDLSNFQSKVGRRSSLKRRGINIPNSPGIYQFKDKKGRIIYIGKAADLRSRILSYWRKSAGHMPPKRLMLKQVEKIGWLMTESEIEALLLEANLIKRYQPAFNVVMRDDKRFVYIKVPTEDEIPGVFITRKIEKSGKYFGPFTSAEAVRQTLKAIRRIWPYCAERRPKKKPCFYYQIGRCLGICAGLVGRREYMDKVIRPIILFLEGKKKKIIKNYELRIKNYEKELKKHKENDKKYLKIKEELTPSKYQLVNIKKVLEHANVLSVSEKYANDVVELAKVLVLPRLPARIEGYDISNIFGREAVGSMVVFIEGEPAKNEYRKFKIKIGQGEANDARMLKEVLERRFKRIKTPLSSLYKGGLWPLPDLIIIDGGRGQLNVALKVLKDKKLDIPIIAISKGEGLRSALARDKIFFPGEKKPLELSLTSPALHLIKRVRDEAHRFAISYHRKLRRNIFKIKHKNTPPKRHPARAGQTSKFLNYNS